MENKSREAGRRSQGAPRDTDPHPQWRRGGGETRLPQKTSATQAAIRGLYLKTGPSASSSSGSQEDFQQRGVCTCVCVRVCT